MCKNTPTMMPDCIYQIFNRGINSEALFKHPDNYSFFLEKLTFYLSPVAELYAYCLMKEHFHLCLKTLSEDAIRANLQLDQLPHNKVEHSCSWHISNQFASIFKSYAQSINKAFRRTGGLFQEPFRRMQLPPDADLRWLIAYVHLNPKLHGFLPHFPAYSYSSYSDLLAAGPTKLNRDMVLSTFGSRKEFATFHRQKIPIDILQSMSMD